MRILVIKLADIGDVLAATPALRALRETFPKARITALLAPAGAAILRASNLVDEIIVFDKYPFDSPTGMLNPRALIDALSLFRQLRRAHFDTVLVLHHLSTNWGVRKFALLTKMTGASRIVGLDNGRGHFLTASLPDKGFGHQHEVEYGLAVVGLLGATTADWRPVMPISQPDKERASILLDGAGPGPLIALHPGSGWYSLARRWPVHRFAAVANALAKDWPPTFVLLGGPDERILTGQLTAAIAAKTIDLGGATTIGETAAILQRCRLFIGNDSGVMHIACAVGCPTVAIFGPSNHRAWGPWTKQGPGDEETESRRAAVVRVDLPCSPCLYVGTSLGQRHGCKALTCMDLVTPEMVVEAAGRTLRAHERQPLHSGD